MNLNRDQREGIAKVSGNLATASMVAAIVGGAVDHKIGWGWTGNDLGAVWRFRCARIRWN